VKAAVVGHVEWVEFVEVDHVPAPGQIGEDDLGRRSVERLTHLGLTVHVQWGGHTRRALVHVDRNRERTITTVGPKLRPEGPLPLAGYDAIFFVAGDVATLRSAREARFLSATPRELETLREGAVHLDLLVGSGTDRGEAYEGGLDAAVVVATEGSSGCIADGVRYASVPPPGPIEDTYGAGDSFAAALTFALARGDSLPDALELASRAGATVITGKGPYEVQLAL
jgi:ribokinase